MNRCACFIALNKGAVIDVWHLTDWVCSRKDKPVMCNLLVCVCVCARLIWACLFVVCVIDEKGGLEPENSYCGSIWWMPWPASLPYIIPLFLWFSPLPHHVFALHVSCRKGRWKRQPRGTSTPWGSFPEKASVMNWRHLKTWGSPCTSISPAVAGKPMYVSQETLISSSFIFIYECVIILLLIYCANVVKP